MRSRSFLTPALASLLLAALAGPVSAVPPPPALVPLLRESARPTAGELARQSAALRRYAALPTTEALGRFGAWVRVAENFGRQQQPDSVPGALHRARRLGAAVGPTVAADVAALVLVPLGQHYYDHQRLDSAAHYFRAGARLFEALSAAALYRRQPVTLVDGRSVTLGSEYAHALANTGIAYAAQNDLLSLAEYLEQAARVYERLADVNGQVWVLGQLAVVASLQHNQQQAARHSLRAAELVQADTAVRRRANGVPDLSAESRAVLNVAAWVGEIGDYPTALRVIARAQERAQATIARYPHDPHLQADYCRQLLAEGRVRLQVGGMARVTARMTPALRRLRQLASPPIYRELLFYNLQAHGLLFRASERPAGPARAALVRGALATIDSLSPPSLRREFSAYLASSFALLHEHAAVLHLMRDVQGADWEYTRWRAAALAGLGRSAEAYDLLISGERHRDSVLGADHRAALAALDSRNRTREKERRIEQLASEARLREARLRQAWLVVGGVALAGLVFVGLYAQLRRARARQRELLRQREQLFAIIGHDLRAPVTDFRYVSRILDFHARQRAAPELAEVAREVETRADALGGLLDNLLDWGRAQAGRLQVRPEPVPLADVLAEAASFVADAARRKQVTVSVEAAAGLRAHTDRRLLLTILRNLVANAIKFTPGGGTVMLCAEATAGTALRLTVRDTGLGLTPEQVQALGADRGRSGTTTTGTAGEGGTGLGIQVVHELLAALGSRLQVAGAPGQGATFWFELPVG